MKTGWLCDSKMTRGCRMNKLGLPSCSSALVGVAMAFVFVLALAPPTRATTLEVKGGPGGRPYNLTCPQGQYLVGFHARAGGWVDAVGIICAPYNASTKRLDAMIHDSRMTGGSGGGPQEVYCPAGEPMMGIGLSFTRGDGLERQYVNTIDIFCASSNVNAPATRCIASGEGCGPIPPHRSGDIVQRVFDYKYDQLMCPPEERAIGIHGASGSAIDGMGLICGPLTPASVPARPSSTPFTSPFAQGIDIPGSDYRSVVMNRNLAMPNNPGDTPNACQNLCVIEERCKAWTWVKPGIQGPTAMCWLKAAVPGPVQNPNTVSGIKASGKTVVH